MAERVTINVRPAVVAGRFYPSNPVQLRENVRDLLDRASVAGGAARDGPTPKAIIAPHAGYQYSGPIAATAYASLAPAAGLVSRVIVAGPAHFWPVGGVAVPGAHAFETPLGPVSVDDAARQRALGVHGVVLDDTAHAEEHSLEVQLPFLTCALGDVAVLPIAVGRSGAGVLAEVLDRLWGGPETRVVISTDLSHYHPAHVASALDRRTADQICHLEPPADDFACGAAAIAGLLLNARRHDLAVRLLDLRNSADTAGDADRVVGYGAFAVLEREP
jgi:MEMO1 family protein